MKKILIGECGKHFSEGLKAHGFSPVILPKENSLHESVGSHADMLCVKLCKKLLFTKEYYEKNRDILGGLDVILTDERHGEKYPSDVLFNVLFTDDAIYAKLDSISKKIVSYAKDHLMKTVNVKQGYAKCSVAKVSGGYITADDGLFKKLTENGETVLKISPGGIVLPGVDYGFIGGASFYYDKTVYFFGDLSSHPDCEKINGFCRQTRTKAVSISSCPLTDIGGAVIL